jgi:carboxyl-terminal processing protease
MILFFSLTNSISFGQLPIPVDSLYTFIKFNSIHRTTVDWKQVDKSFREQLKTAKSINDTMNCFVTVLKSLNDVHSQIFLNNRFYGHYPSFDDSVLVWLKPLNDKAISVTNKVYTQNIMKGIGYIRVPAFQIFDSKQINAYAQTLADSITKLSKKSKKGFIIDLRLNGGGNIYPMLSGLSQLLGNQTVGYETDINDSIIRIWEIKNGNFFIGGYQTTDIKVKPNPNLTKITIVVIIGPVTKSAGSMVAIGFKGRPNTYFIGEPTADGYTTSNGYFQFASNLTLNFATNYVADRNKMVYKTTVNPDLTIHQRDNFDNLMNDDKIKAAIKWLTEK